MNTANTANTDWNEKTKLLLGSQKQQKLCGSHVAVIGLGGVGAAAAEHLVRAGILQITLIDHDVFEKSNLNRQILATTSTIGVPKVEAAAIRFKNISPELKVNAHRLYIDKDQFDILNKSRADIVLDCIDTLRPKTDLLEYLLHKKIPVISSMGAGGKTDPSLIQCCDLSETYQCRLAYYLRKHLRKRGISKGIRTVFSPEPVARNALVTYKEIRQNKRSTVGTISYMPALFGGFAAAEAMKVLLTD